MRRPLLMRSPSPPGVARLSSTRWLAATLLTLLLWTAAMAATASPLWLDQGRPTDAARQAVAVLASAADDALQPEDYDAEPLAQALVAAAQGPGLDAVAATRLDDALTAAMRRYLGDLHTGRVNPRQIHANFSMPSPDRIDAATYLEAALAGGRFADAVRAAAPQVPLYAALRAELARYRALIDHPAWAAPLPAPVGRKLEAGAAWAGLPLLTQRLVALGDLPPGTAVSEVYDDVLQQGVKAFQQRHALTADGVLGKGTLAQLTVAPAERVRQIGLAMERLRWTPLLQAPRMIVVNVPEFVLRAYEAKDGKVSLRLAMNVIVGKALNTQTPLFNEDMRFIEFSPYWNVPPSIARGETVPRLRRDPAYLEQQGFEFVSAGGQVDATLSDENLDAVVRGRMRIRQRPGPLNALGDIKFVFPNNSNIYLHHTPAPGLFQRERRDLSHGCIRVEEPVALAQFVLQNAPEWSEARIRAAMAQGQSSTVRLAEPLPVVIAYSTTIVKRGKVHFFADIYGHDRLLDHALRRQAQARAGQRGTGSVRGAQ
jgi:murein L,D-transpeptidase YcbB/YkuD